MYVMRCFWRAAAESGKIQMFCDFLCHLEFFNFPIRRRPFVNLNADLVTLDSGTVDNHTKCINV